MFGKGGPKKKVTKRPACNAQKGNAKKENIAKQTSEEYAAGETIDQTVDHPQRSLKKRPASASSAMAAASKTWRLSGFLDSSSSSS